MSTHWRGIIVSALVAGVLTLPVAGEPIIPDVPFVIVRVDSWTGELRQAYRFTQPMRKTLPPLGWEVAGDFAVDAVDQGDIGHTEVVSQQTGQRVLFATYSYEAYGRLEWPTAAEEISTTIAAGRYDVPDRFHWWSQWDDAEQRAREAWAVAREVDAVAALASDGRYGVFALEHEYGIEIEWHVFVYGLPAAPPDVALSRVEWPRTVVTRGVAVSPELRVDNFGDAAVDCDVAVEIHTRGGIVYSERRNVGLLTGDGTRTVVLPPWVPGKETRPVLRAWLRPAGSGSWSDTHDDNDARARTLTVSERPAFRVVGSLRAPERVPLEGDPIDFDGDGDADIVQHGRRDPYDREVRFWRNDGGYRFVDVTASFEPPTRHISRAVAEDFNGDGLVDVLISYYERHPRLYINAGAGRWVDISAELGLVPFDGSRSLAPIDLDDDGDLDILLWRRGHPSGAKWVALNDGQGNFTDGTTLFGLAVDDTYPSGVTVGDVDFDGRRDVVFAVWEAPSRIYRNVTPGTFVVAAELDGKYGRAPLLLDYDRDGQRDVFLARPATAAGSSLYRQIGAWLFDDVTAEAGPLGDAWDGDAADFDADGWPDLLLDIDLRVLVNLGGRFVRPEPPLLVDLDEHPEGFDFARWVDLDVDGDLDVYSRFIALENLGLPPPD